MQIALGLFKVELGTQDLACELSTCFWCLANFDRASFSTSTGKNLRLHDCSSTELDSSSSNFFYCCTNDSLGRWNSVFAE